MSDETSIELYTSSESVILVKLRGHEFALSQSEALTLGDGLVALVEHLRAPSSTGAAHV